MNGLLDDARDSGHHGRDGRLARHFPDRPG